MSTTATDRAALEAALLAALRESSALAVLFSQAVADRVGLSPTDVESLDVLVRSGPMTAGQLSELTGLTTGGITGLIDRLERRGYVRREPNPADRRSIIVQPLTENALRDLAPAYVGMDQGATALFARYSDEELATVLDFMNRATAMTTEEIARLRAETAGRGASPPS